MWCGYAGCSLEVKIETDSNDAVEIKTEADCLRHDHPYDVSECLHDNQTISGMFRSSVSYLHFLNIESQT